MNGYYPLRTLDAKLFEKSRSDYGRGGHKGIGIEQGGAGNTHGDYADTATEYLAGKPDDRPAEHGTQVGDHLGYGYGIGGEVELVL